MRRDIAGTTALIGAAAERHADVVGGLSGHEPICSAHETRIPPPLHFAARSVISVRATAAGRGRRLICGRNPPIARSRRRWSGNYTGVADERRSELRATVSAGRTPLLVATRGHKSRCAVPARAGRRSRTRAMQLTPAAWAAAPGKREAICFWFTDAMSGIPNGRQSGAREALSRGGANPNLPMTQRPWVRGRAHRRHRRDTRFSLPALPQTMEMMRLLLAAGPTRSADEEQHTAICRRDRCQPVR